jgi:2-dehydropantoate 2-reductase
MQQQEKRNLNILIYGGGAVGLGIASCLIKSEQHVDILARKQTADSLKKEGLIRSGIFGTFRAEKDRFQVVESLPQIISRKAYDYILVCTKSFDSPKVGENLAENPHVFGEDTAIILCQNGWGNAEMLSPFFDEKNLFNARVITGFSRPKPNHVEITVHVDAIRMGSIYNKNLDSLKSICESIAKGGIPCEISYRIIRDIWAKMLYNCALNPLGAIFNVPYGKLGESRHTSIIMENIIKEIFRVMDKAGYETEWHSAEEYLAVFFNSLIPATAKHEASTLQDIKAMKKTEIDALNGAVVKLGKQYGVDVPFNKMVTEMIKFKEEQYPVPGDYSRNLS